MRKSLCSKIRTIRLSVVLGIVLYPSAAILKSMEKAKTRNHAFALATILGLILISFSSLSFASADSYNNVQIFIQTRSSLPDYFSVSAFNISGYMVASSQTHYPAASFELPSGQYIFTVIAQQQYYSTYYSSEPTRAVNSTEIKTPIVAQGPVMEYGYSVAEITSSKTFTISTIDDTSLSKKKLAIKVTYANGTAAQGASVYASVLGGYYGGYENKLMMSNVTDVEGISNLVVIDAPVQVYAWSWLPVNLPEDKSSVQMVDVGGEKVNVTVYWQPTYVGLAGQALVVPPESNAAISLLVQQSSYWVTPYGPEATTATKDSTTGSSSQDSVPAAIYQQSQTVAQGLTSTVVPPSTVTSAVTSSNREPTLTLTSSSSESSIGIPAGSTLLLALVAVLVGVTGTFIISMSTRKEKQPA